MAYYDTSRARHQSMATHYTQYPPSMFSTHAAHQRPSTSSSSVAGSMATQRNDMRRSTRPRRNSDHQSIMSSQTTKTAKRTTRKVRPPTPPPKDFISFTPAMNADEDAQSDIRAVHSRLRGFVKSIANVFRPSKMRHSSSDYQRDNSSLGSGHWGPRPR